MNILKRRTSQIMAVNGNFFGAVIILAYGWVLWPDDPRWYGLYIIGVICFMASIAFVIRALRLMKEMYLQEKLVAEYQSKVKPQKDAEMASDQTLEKARMIDA